MKDCTCHPCRVHRVFFPAGTPPQLAVAIARAIFGCRREAWADEPRKLSPAEYRATVGAIASEYSRRGVAAGGGR